MNEEVKILYNILVEMFGESKSGYESGQYQYEFPCPHCIEKYGMMEAQKYNLSISLSKQRANCWKCSSEGDDMHGSIIKLIKMYGNDELLKQYTDAIKSIRESQLYKVSFKDDEFSIDTSIIAKEYLKFPSKFRYFKENGRNNNLALEYLNNRGIGWDIINRFKLGYTEAVDDDRKYSYRVIIPSYNAFGELNYWVGRDYLPTRENSFRTKYSNPVAEKKEIIFNEGLVQWDADIVLVEGAFDHIVVPNSIPLLGKALNKKYKLYWDLFEKSNGLIYIWLDADAKSTAVELYKLLNHGRLYNRIRYVPTYDDEDPSSLYQKGGYKEIVRHFRNAQQFKEAYLF